MKQPIEHGMFAEEAAGALNMSNADFLIAVAAGRLPQAIGHDKAGRARWDGREIGRIVRERFGPVSLQGIVDTLDRMNRRQRHDDK